METSGCVEGQSDRIFEMAVKRKKSKVSRKKSPPKRSGKVLLVEDDHILLKALQKKLSIDGFTTYTATDGITGLEVLEKAKPDLVVLDILLPDASGMDFLKSIDRGKHPRLKIIALTNLEDEGVRRQAFGLGVDEHLIKARVSLKELSDIIEEKIRMVEEE